MKKTSKILVPVDFSKSSENALHYAILMADKINATIMLAHIVSPDVAVIEIPVAVDIAVNEKMKIAKEKMTEITGRVLTRVLRKIKNVPVIDYTIEIGPSENTITKYAKAEDFDFIFIGTRGEHNVIDRVFGSVASNVMKYAHCAVLVIPENAEYHETTLVSYATDLSAIDPFEIFRVSKLLAPFNPIIRCVHFYDQEKKEHTPMDMNELKSFFSEQAPALQITFHEVATENKTESLMDFLETYDINLLTMYKPHRGFWERIRHRSFTKEIVLASTVPILILKER